MGYIISKSEITIRKLLQILIIDIMSFFKEYFQPELAPNPTKILAEAEIQYITDATPNLDAAWAYFDRANHEVEIRKDEDPEGTHFYTNADISIFEAVWSLNTYTMRLLCQKAPLTMAVAVRNIPDDWWTTRYNNTIGFAHLQNLCESFPPGSEAAQWVLDATLRRMRASTVEHRENLAAIMEMRILENWRQNQSALNHTGDISQSDHPPEAHNIPAVNKLSTDKDGHGPKGLRLPIDP